MKVNESHIEKYVRFPETLSSQEFKEIKQFISANRDALELAEFYTSYYAEFDKLNRPNRLTLHYFKPEVNLRAPFVLAADSKESNKTPLVTKATFSSEETGTLVRILEDRNNQSYQLHVLSKLLGDDERVLIQFDEPALNFVTEKGGKLKNIKEHGLSTIDWASLTLILSLPRSNCSYHPETGMVTVCDDCTLEAKGETFIFNTIESEVKKILVEQVGVTELHMIEAGTMTFRADKNQPFTIYLYS